MLEVVAVSVDDPEVVMEVGLKLAVAPWGNPLTLRPTVPVKPFDAATLMV